MSGLLLEHRLPDVDRLIESARRRLGYQRHLDAERQATRAVVLDLLRLGQDLQQLRAIVRARLAAATTAVEGAVKVQHLWLRSVDLADALVVLVGLLKVGQLVPVQPTDL